MIKKIVRFLWKAMLWFFGISIFLVILFKFVPVPFTPLMGIRAIEQKKEGKEMICSHDWVPIEEISINLQKAVIASEDGHFLTHNGFDFEAIEKAMEANKKENCVEEARFRNKRQKMFFYGKAEVIYVKDWKPDLTVLIELIWGKERIMEVYLNSIEMGNGVYGAQEASRVWYRKDAKNLTPREAAGIAAILPNPRKFKASNSSNYINRRKNFIVKQMSYLGKIEY